MNVSSGTGLPGLSRIKGRKMVVVVVIVIHMTLQGHAVSCSMGITMSVVVCF